MTSTQLHQQKEGACSPRRLYEYMHHDPWCIHCVGGESLYVLYCCIQVTSGNSGTLVYKSVKKLSFSPVCTHLHICAYPLGVLRAHSSSTYIYGFFFHYSVQSDVKIIKKLCSCLVACPCELRVHVSAFVCSRRTPSAKSGQFPVQIISGSCLIKTNKWICLLVDPVKGPLYILSVVQLKYIWSLFKLNELCCWV